MPRRKPWTVLVYIAADNNLRNFGVDSLKQMKAVSRDCINVVAEFDTGPMKPARRYLFDGGTPFGSIEQNLIDTHGPTNAADPENLAAFLQWGADRFPADHYFVIIWGHGAGIDDFPRTLDPSFVPRHQSFAKGAPDIPMKGALDIPMKGVLDIPMKGTLDVPMKGTLDVPMKGTLDVPMKGILGAPMTGVLDAPMNGVLNTPMQGVADALQKGDDQLHEALLTVVRTGVLHALGEDVLDALARQGLAIPNARQLSDSQLRALKAFKEHLLKELDNAVLAQLKNGALASLRLRLAEVLGNGIAGCLQIGNILELQKMVLRGLSGSDASGLIERLPRMLAEGMETGIIEALRLGASNNPAAHAPAPGKSVAFSDHPASHISNLGLKDALRRASKHMGRIDILGLDACNMNMVEIGYEVRDSVRFMVASQDNVPNGSWLYDRLLAQLVQSPDILPADLAGLTASTYVRGYQDYVSQPVTLSVLDLDAAKTIKPLVRKLATALRKTIADRAGRKAIMNARQQTRSFGANQFVDLIHFCQLLTGASGSPAAAMAASQFIATFKSLIACNQTSAGESNCNGTSIYFPQHNPQDAEHEIRLGRLYNSLQFAKDTGWGEFVSGLLNHQQEEMMAAVALQGTANRPAGNDAHTTQVGDEYYQQMHHGDSGTPFPPLSGAEGETRYTNGAAGHA